MKTLANGAVVPADTPSVAAAKRAHQNAGGAINPSSHSPASISPSSYSPSSIPQSQHVPQMKTLANGAVVPADTPAVAAAKQAHYNAGGAINPSSSVPALHTLANGAVVPADTPAVAAAKRAHQNAGGAINPSSHSPASINPSSYSPASIPQLQHFPQMKTLANGAVVPADTPSVAAAKIAHQNAGGAINPSS